MRLDSLMLPREHGAWGLLLQPFLAAAILGRRWDWLYLPVAALILVTFILREPLLTLARQRWLWKDAKRESRTARRCLAWELPLAAALAAVCLAYLPAAPFLILAAVAVSITVLATWMALRNRQRSIALQVISTAGLTTTGLLGALVAARALPGWAWVLCGLLALHAVASILVVRTRLEMRAGRPGGPLSRWAWLALAATALIAAALAASGRIAFAAVAAFTAAVNALEMLRLRRGGALAEPLQRVGFRALAASLAHTVFTVAALW